MSASLVVLCFAAFAIAAAAVSGLVGAMMVVLDRLAARLSARNRARFWLSIAALPTVVAALAIGTSFLPAVGIGHDHCLAHGPHHPHLCPHHIGGAPGIVLVLIALLLGVRLLQATAALIRGLWLSSDTSSTLWQASDRYADALVFPSDEPQAFVLGALRPRVHVSRGLLALGDKIADPVLAHERVHAARHDLLWRALFPVLAIGHVPSTAQALRSRLCAAQEMAADSEAADALGDGRFEMAEALLVLARVARPVSRGISFTDGNIQSRVHALLERPSVHSAWPARALAVGAGLVPIAVAVLSAPIHHVLETVLGALS